MSVGRGVPAPAAGRYEEAKKSAEWFARIFGPDGFWLEIQQHGIGEERTVTDGMFRLGEGAGLGVVATNDAHYLRREDAEAHDVLLASAPAATSTIPSGSALPAQESYVKSETEMRALFPEHPEVLENTQRVADALRVRVREEVLPARFPRPAEYASDEALLEHLAREGAERRYGAPLPPSVAERLDYELGVINKAGYAGYFLIVQDFIAAARDAGIPGRPGPRLGGGLARRLRARHHRRLSRSSSTCCSSAS